MLDFHTHILHRIDDGADSVETSVKMLEEAYKNGAQTVVLTSHFYPRDQQKLEDFLELRKKRYERLKKRCEGRDVPKLRLGAEVHLGADVSKIERIKELSIDGTDYMMIEMPPVRWEEWMIESIYNLKRQGIKPVMAHIDRYYKQAGKWFSALDQIGVVYQVNADALLTHKGRKRVLKLFKSARIHILGSDMHGLEKRKNRLPEAYEKLEKLYGAEYVRLIEKNGSRILENKSVITGGILPYPKSIFIRI